MTTMWSFVLAERVMLLPHSPEFKAHVLTSIQEVTTRKVVQRQFVTPAIYFSDL